MMSKQLLKTLLIAVIGGAFGVSAHAAILSATNIDQVVVDEASATRSVVLGAGIITKVVVTLDFMKCDDPLALPPPLPAACVGQALAFENEIIFRLTSPAGTVISLVEADTYTSNSSPGARVTVIFDDLLGSDFVGMSGLVSETAKPIQSLALLDGQNAFGNWELYLEDTAGADPLGLASFRLDVTVLDRQVPEPATLALFGLGLIGLGALRRRRK